MLSQPQANFQNWGLTIKKFFGNIPVAHTGESNTNLTDQNMTINIQTKQAEYLPADLSQKFDGRHECTALSTSLSRGEKR